MSKRTAAFHCDILLKDAFTASRFAALEHISRTSFAASGATMLLRGKGEIIDVASRKRALCTALQLRAVVFDPLGAGSKIVSPA